MKSIQEIKDGSQAQSALMGLMRETARGMLQQALELEREQFLREYEDLKDATGRQRVVANGYHQERKIDLPVGSIPVKVPRVRDRGGDGKVAYLSNLVPKYLRRSRELEEFIPLLYLRGISSNDFSEVLSSLLGSDIKISPNTILRLTESWKKDFADWQKRDLTGKQYVYWWADGIYCNARKDSKSCLLVIIGADKNGKKEPLAVVSGYSEATSAWSNILADLKRRGLTFPPELAIADGALGFWGAMAMHFPDTTPQRCWVHKTRNVLGEMPKSIQTEAKSAIHEIYMAPTKEKALAAFDNFISTYQAKYPKAVQCLSKDRETTLAFYDYPAEHWQHIRSTNPIESIFATVRLRMYKTRGCRTAANTEVMAFKLIMAAQKRWRKLRGYNQIPLVMAGKIFKDGILQQAA